MRQVLPLIFSVLFLVSCNQVTSPTESNQSNVATVSSKNDMAAVQSTDVDAFVEAFMGYCVLPMPRIEKIKAMSKLNSWEPLEEDMLVAFGPAEPNIDMLGWMVQGNNNPMFVATTDGIIDAERHRNCTIMSKVSDVDDLSEKIIDIVGANTKPRLSEIEAGQRYRVWGYEHLQQKFRLIITDSPEFAPGVMIISTNFVSQPI